MRRAPVRFTAMARSALPRSERSKYSQSMTIRATVAAKVMMAWPDSMTGPMVKRSSQNAGLRKPSAPKNSRPRPVMAKCTPTETISKTSGVALSSDW
ncbi:hypothetical protein D9M68_812230 [compost metagenome]